MAWEWEEKVHYIHVENVSEQQSLEDYCEKSDYKYFVNFLAGHRYIFHLDIENYESFAVSNYE